MYFWQTTFFNINSNCLNVYAEEDGSIVQICNELNAKSLLISHDLYAAFELLVLQHLLYGTNFQLLFNFRTLSLVLNRVLKRFYFELLTVVKS